MRRSNSVGINWSFDVFATKTPEPFRALPAGVCVTMLAWEPQRASTGSSLDGTGNPYGGWVSGPWCPTAKMAMYRRQAPDDMDWMEPPTLTGGTGVRHQPSQERRSTTSPDSFDD